MTIACSQERMSEPHEDHVFRLHHARLQVFFPDATKLMIYDIYQLSELT
jgi:hypothetical protein